MRAPLILLVALIAGCGPSPEVTQCPTTLVDHYRWSIVPETGEVGRKGPCGRNDVTSEFFGAEPSVSVITTDCSAATLEQPTMIPVAAGAAIHLRVYHYALTSSVTGVGHLELALGDDSLWTQDVDIPSEGELFETDVVVPSAAAAATPIRWHVDNHGDNSWNLIELSVMADCPVTE
ncbi:MAG: hypothetical protein RMA76_00275 [Deltaproteobacteria bacterium]